MGTHSYAILEVSPAAYAEIHVLLVKAGYEHAFHEQDEGIVIDMHGIALRAKAPDGSVLTESPDERNTAADAK